MKQLTSTSCGWTVKDVLSRDKTLSREEAEKILMMANCCACITWHILDQEIKNYRNIQKEID